MPSTLYIVYDTRIIKFDQVDDVTFDEFARVSDLSLPTNEGIVYISDNLQYKIINNNQGSLSNQEIIDSKNILANKEQILKDVHKLRQETINGDDIIKVQSILLQRLDVIFLYNLNNRIPTIILKKQEIISSIWDIKYWFDTISILSIKLNKLNQDQDKGNTNNVLTFDIRNKDNTDLQTVSVNLESCMSLIDQLLQYRSLIEAEQIKLVKLIQNTDDMEALNNIDIEKPFKDISVIFKI